MEWPNKLPVFEPGLETIIKEVRNKNLFFQLILMMQFIILK